MSCAASDHGRRRRGQIIVLTAILLVVVLGMVAFALDLGTIALRRTESQRAADAAALAAVNMLRNSSGRPSDLDSLRKTADQMLRHNGFAVGASKTVERSLQVGIWDYYRRTFRQVSDRNRANAVRVSLSDKRVPMTFGRVFGRSTASAGAEAIAAMGGTPRDVVLVIDCSTSMSAPMSNGLTRMENTRAAAISLVDQLQPDDRVGLAVFSWYDANRKRYKFTGFVEHNLGFDKTPVKNRITQLDDGEYGRGTCIGGGLRAGLDIFASATPRPDPRSKDLERIMVLLTDSIVNEAEPYPTPDDGSSGVLPSPPYKRKYNAFESVRQWSNAVKARGIKLYVITLSDEAYDPTIINAASPNDGHRRYHYHISDGTNDAGQLLNVFRKIGRGSRRPTLVM